MNTDNPGQLGFALKVANGWKLREAISLAPWLQPGDPEAILTALTVLTVYRGVKTVETVGGRIIMSLGSPG
jgi:hypothetical protein